MEVRFSGETLMVVYQECFQLQVRILLKGSDKSEVVFVT